MDDLTRRLYLAAHDEWDISAESRDLARDALAEIERLRALLAEVMDVACYEHRVGNEYDFTYIQLNDAAKLALALKS